MFPFVCQYRNGSTLIVNRGKSPPPPTFKAQEIYPITNALYDMSAGGAPCWPALSAVYLCCPHPLRSIPVTIPTILC